MSVLDSQSASRPSDPVTISPGETEFTPQWGDSAPRGGRTVLSRILKDGAKVPLFLGQTLVNSLRDLGYNSTTSAACEFVDNAVQWGATEIRVYFHQTGQKGTYQMDVLVMDNGQGMSPHVLKVASAFGGSMVYANRSGIGRYGMGMKAAALSMGPVMELYSWQEPRAIYNMTLDVEDIGNNRSNLLELSDPTLIDELPSDVTQILSRPMAFPKRPAETQDLFVNDDSELPERLGASGTIVFVPNCDRVSYRKAQTLVEHATKEMGRIYRRFIEGGLKLYINNRRVEAFDPTYWMQSARHTRLDGLVTTQSRLLNSWQVTIPVGEGSEETAVASVRLYMLPFHEWGQLSRKVLRNDLHVYEDHTVSFMRNDREVAIGSDARLGLRTHHTNNWIRIQIDFSGELDEAFGVAANKQGVRPKGYVYDIIKEKIADDVAALRRSIRELKAKFAAGRTGSRVSEAERRATEAEATQGKPLPIDPAPQTDDERQALDANLRGLAMAVKREDESDDEAFERVTSSKYLVVFKHDDYWPFYHCEFKYGKAILTVNTAHAFFQKLWQPLSDIAKAAGAEVESTADGEPEVDTEVAERCTEALVGLQLLLLSLARTQGQLSLNDADGHHQQLFEKLRREWSENLRTQLHTK